MRQKGIIFNNTSFFPEQEGGSTTEEGVAIREYFAMNILRSLISKTNGEINKKYIAEEAVQIADELIIALMK